MFSDCSNRNPRQYHLEGPYKLEAESGSSSIPMSVLRDDHCHRCSRIWYRDN